MVGSSLPLCESLAAHCGYRRKWTNTEVIAHDVGVRLEHLQQHQIDLIWELLKESLSETGYAKARGVVKMNKFLGELVNSRPTLNENTYTYVTSSTFPGMPF